MSNATVMYLAFGLTILVLAIAWAGAYRPRYLMAGLLGLAALGLVWALALDFAHAGRTLGGLGPLAYPMAVAAIAWWYFRRPHGRMPHGPGGLRLGGTA